MSSSIFRNSLITRLHVSIGLVLLVVFSISTTIDVSHEESAVISYGDQQLAQQKEVQAARIKDAEQQLITKLTLQIEAMTDFARAPLVSRISELDDAYEITNDEVIEDFHSCFALSAKVLIVSCLKSQANDASTYRTIAAFNRLFIKTAAEHLVQDADVVAVYVLDWENKLYLGVRDAGQIGFVQMQALEETSSTAPHIAKDVEHDNEYIGKVVVVYSLDRIAELRKSAAEQYANTQKLIAQSTRLQASQVTLRRIVEGLVLFLILLAAISLVSFKTIVTPLQRLKNSANQLARGQWKCDLDIQRSDELGNLASAFARMRNAIRESLEATEQQRELAQTTLASIGDGVITTDVDGTVRYLNPVAEAMTGWYTHQAEGRPIEAVFSVIEEGTRLRLDCPITRSMNGELSDGMGHQGVLLGSHGKEYSIVESVAPIRNAAEKILGYVVSFHDVTEQRLLSMQLKHQATHDILTGLLNRGEFEQRVKKALRDNSDAEVIHALCIIDLDQFKTVNDTCGHAAGDRLLVQIAHNMSQHVHADNALARLGGDEFGLLLENCSIQQAKEIVESLHHAIEQTRFTWENRVFPVSASIGLTFVDPASHTCDEAFLAADNACYVAKVSGRNQIHTSNLETHATGKQKSGAAWCEKLLQATNENDFQLFCQPIIALSTGLVNSYEILLRLRDTDNNILVPGSFMAAAVRYDIMPDIDRWVIRNVFAWMMHNTESTPGITFNINISAASLSQPDFAEYLLMQMQHYRINPNQICFEITEAAALANISRTCEQITAVKKVGCRFALDDFGSGLSTFNYLKTLPLDYLKIDGVFVRNMENSQVDVAVLKSVHDVCQVMGIKTVAEFVENDATLEKLKRIGVNYAQGYAITKPFPIEKISENNYFKASKSASTSNVYSIHRH